MSRPGRRLAVTALALFLIAGAAFAVDEATRADASSPEYDKRKDAVRALAKEGSPEAVRLLVKLLGDPDPRVRDLATSQCSRLQDDTAVEILAGALARGSATSRRAVAAALAETGRAAALEPLAKASRSDADATVRAEAAEAMRKFKTDPRAVAVCAEAAKDRDPLVRAAALYAAAHLPANAGGSVLRAAFADPDEGVRAAAITSMWREDAESSMPAAAADRSWRVRAACVDAAMHFRTVASVDALVPLVADPNDRVASAAARALRRLTQKDYARDAELWAAWWKQNRAAWLIPQGDLADPRVAEKSGTRARFMGVEMEGEGTAFVLDFSGSMQEEVRGGGTRLTLVRSEFAKTIASLPDGHAVNVLLFDDRVRAFEKRAKPLTPKSREQICDYVNRQSLGWQTNFLGGILEAMEDDRVDAIYVLSDGAPTVGEATRDERVRTLLRRVNRTRRIVIHVVGVGVTDEDDREFLRSIASGHGGSCVLR